MTEIVISGRGSVRPSATGSAPAWARPGDPVALTGGHPVLGLDPVLLLGRKSVTYNHRTTHLAMVACQRAVEDAGLTIDDDNRDRIGVTLGTTAGSVTGMAEFGIDTFRQARPYLVKPADFPSAVINTSAGALAIRHGLRGANCTVATAALGTVSAFRQAALALSAGHADTLLVGAAEEFTEPTARWAASARDTGPLGEGAAMFVLETAATAAAAGRTARATVLGSRVDAVEAADPADTARVVSRLLGRAGLPADRIDAVLIRATGVPEADLAHLRGLAAAGLTAAPTRTEDLTGDCLAAHTALQIDRELAAAVPGRTVLFTALDADGALGVLLLRLHDRSAAEAAA
ncbi:MULTISPECIES: beta-ketoacyl synthase N-terminal-like domain-containing protein [Kitasatospora]|uniref:Putative 3-oxoacyl-[acyl-carrier-protein] synthase n=1 Tax=Kitasatospora setae (strain ATCC 33774 / DSM 43861 / JCM 3304 / KCC A-0304 / NBRC 14216 / KM-6054) TaxID=452652 RepID=E4N2H4_KITSK|nr:MULTISPECIES: beta-ketoacyl synthase N-terminal-like domain-containing protein [Kitasatospora]BAJ32358.1 putative 3-oxoacyl-[acyl-carrier-protein] synthase [Kitasatospora setae KM-6054]